MKGRGGKAVFPAFTVEFNKRSGLGIRRIRLVLQKKKDIRNNTHINLMKKTLLLSSCIAMLGLLCTAQGAGTLLWDMSFTGTSSSPSASNIVVTGADGNAYTTLSPNFGGGSVTNGIYNSVSGNRMTFTDSASPIKMKDNFSFVVKASLNAGSTSNWPVLFGLGEAGSWNLKVNYTKGDNAGWTFSPEGYSLSNQISTAGTVVQGVEQTFIVTVATGANNTGLLTLYLNGEIIATATLASTNRTNELLDTFSLGGRPISTQNTQSADFSNVQLYQGVLSAEQIASLSGNVPESATASLSLTGLALLALRRRRPQH